MNASQHYVDSRYQRKVGVWWKTTLGFARRGGTDGTNKRAKKKIINVGVTCGRARPGIQPDVESTTGTTLGRMFYHLSLPHFARATRVKNDEEMESDTDTVTTVGRTKGGRGPADKKITRHGRSNVKHGSIVRTWYPVLQPRQKKKGRLRARAL